MIRTQGADLRGLALVAQLQRAPARLLQPAHQEARASGAGGQRFLFLSQRKDKVVFPQTSHFIGRERKARKRSDGS